MYIYITIIIVLSLVDTQLKFSDDAYLTRIPLQSLINVDRQDNEDSLQ